MPVLTYFNIIFLYLVYTVHHVSRYLLSVNTWLICGTGRSVGIATAYGLDGPGSTPGGVEIFRSSRPALEPTQPPVKWVPGLSRE